MKDLQVKKKDGSYERWILDKLVVSIEKSGVPPSDAERISKEIEDWARVEAKDNVIESSRIREKVIEKLRLEFPLEAESYRSYRK